MEERGFRQRDMFTMEQLLLHVSPIAGTFFSHCVLNDVLL